MIPLHVILLVLLAALFHAVWNALVKGGPDKLLSAVLVTSGSGAAAACALPFLPWPASASLPYMAAGVVAQSVYVGLLAATYRIGDMSQTYPVMRGTAPLIVAMASGPVIGESLSLGRWIGVGLISGGVVGMALSGWRAETPHLKALTFALLNACAIAAYTILDGIGVRRSGAPVGYAFWSFVLLSISVLTWAAVRRPGACLPYAAAHWPVAVVGGFGTLVSYTVALWAMTVAPVAVIAALREVAILFATAISAFVLKEHVRPARLAAIGIIVAGAVVIRGF